MIEIKEGGLGAWHVYLLTFEEGVEIRSMYGDNKESCAAISAIQELPEDLKNAVLLGLTLPITDSKTSIHIDWRGDEVHLARYLDQNKKEVLEFNSDTAYTITELLKP